jgi:general stress protein YciG
LASHEFYQASSKQVKTFIAAEHLFPRNFDFRGFASMDREKQLAIARKGGESVPNEKAQFYAKSEIGGRGRTECQSQQAQLFAQSRARIGGRPQGRTRLAPRAEKSQRSLRHPS